MIFNNVYIEELEYQSPPDVITSEAIEVKLASLYKKLKLPHGRLELMTGIKERRQFPIGTRPSEMAIMAASKIFNKRPELKSEIDLIIFSSVCRDFLEPATASVIHSRLELNEDCAFFDLSNACLGFMQATQYAAKLVEKKVIRKALIVSGENGTPLLDGTINKLLTDTSINRKTIKPYIANLTIGSAAVAAVISNNGKIQLLGGVEKTDSSAHTLCQGSGDLSELTMKTDSEALLKAGINLTKKTWKKAQQELSFNKDNFKYVMGHQVGIAHQQQVLGGLDLQDLETHTTFPTYGNTGSAALPLTLASFIETNKAKKNEQALLVGIGSGLSCLIQGVKWC